MKEIWDSEGARGQKMVRSIQWTNWPSGFAIYHKKNEGNGDTIQATIAIYPQKDHHSNHQSHTNNQSTPTIGGAMTQLAQNINSSDHYEI
jgi:hypothetical protein